MDPVATLDRCDQAISDCDLMTAREALADYHNWRARGGFEPHMRHSAMHGDDFARECARRIESQAAQGNAS